MLEALSIRPEVPPRRGVSVLRPVELVELARDEISVVCLRRVPSLAVRAFVDRALVRPHRGRVVIDAGDPSRRELRELLPASASEHDATPWLDDVAELSEIYADLLEARQLGVRLAVLEAAMCPRFHVDWVEARAACTYRGAGTEWLEGEAALAALAAAGRAGIDETPIDASAVQRASTTDLVLMKGMLWPGPPSGAVHRSPAQPTGRSREATRVIVTWDVLD
jgi:hypothetical protein